MPRIIGRYWPILGNLAILAVGLFKSTLMRNGFHRKLPHVYLVEMLTDKTGAVLSTSRTVHSGRYPVAKGENETETEDEEQAYKSVERTMKDEDCLLNVALGPLYTHEKREG